MGFRPTTLGDKVGTLVIGTWGMTETSTVRNPGSSATDESKSRLLYWMLRMSLNRQRVRSSLLLYFSSKLTNLQKPKDPSFKGLRLRLQGLGFKGLGFKV